ncbi:MAG: hypothetical protein ABSG59_09510 [Verrucomicrobiota bacterium]|jgi:hypothetical protein
MGDFYACEDWQRNDRQANGAIPLTNMPLTIFGLLGSTSSLARNLQQPTASSLIAKIALPNGAFITNT